MLCIVIGCYCVKYTLGELKNNMAEANSRNLPLQKYKVVFLGETSVGKTSIIKQMSYGVFEPSCGPTLGIDFISKTLYTSTHTVRLQIWDTAGQEYVVHKQGNEKPSSSVHCQLLLLKLTLHGSCGRLHTDYLPPL